MKIDKHTIRYDASEKGNKKNYSCEAYVVVKSSYMAYNDIYGEEISGRTINGLYSELKYYELGSYIPWMYDDGIKADMDKLVQMEMLLILKKVLFRFISNVYLIVMLSIIKTILPILKVIIERIICISFL